MPARSLHELTIEAVGNFLYQEKFPYCPVTPRGIVALLNAIHSYTEEGNRLYPEAVVTTNLDGILSTIASTRVLVVDEVERTVANFRRALKRCAPLARDGWVLFFELLGNDRLRYGIVSVEASELSAPLSDHLVGQLVVAPGDIPLAYLSCIGFRQVQLKGSSAELSISVSLDEDAQQAGDEISQLATLVTCDVPEDIRATATTFFKLVLDRAIQQSHGCLIAVVHDADLPAVREELDDGVYLPEPIAFGELLAQSEELKSREASTAVRSYSSVLAGMIGQDGVTLLTTQGVVVGYNIFVRRGIAEAPGGARSRAHEALVKTNLLRAVLAVSHDGGVKLWRHSDES